MSASLEDLARLVAQVRDNWTTALPACQGHDMGFMPERTIASMLDGLYKHEFVLPAIQREFVWSSSQICRLFDSLMRGYPIGTFLTWKVPSDQVQNHVFYDFI